MKKLFLLLGLYYSVLLASIDELQELEIIAIKTKINHLYKELRDLRSNHISLEEYLNVSYLPQSLKGSHSHFDLQRFDEILSSEIVIQLVLELFHQLSDEDRLFIREKYEFNFRNIITSFNYIKVGGASFENSNNYKNLGNQGINETLTPRLSFIKMLCMSNAYFHFLFIQSNWILHMSPLETEYFAKIIYFSFLYSEILQRNLLQQVVFE